LVNYLQHKVDDSLLTIFFRAGLITYLKVVIVSMKCNSLFEHKEVVVIYEESMGDPIEYQKLLEPSKLDINNDGKHTNLVCSQSKNKGIVRSVATIILKIQIINSMKRRKFR